MIDELGMPCRADPTIVPVAYILMRKASWSEDALCLEWLTAHEGASIRVAFGALH